MAINFFCTIQMVSCLLACIWLYDTLRIMIHLLWYIDTSIIQRKTQNEPFHDSAWMLVNYELKTDTLFENQHIITVTLIKNQVSLMGQDYTPNINGLM